MRFALLGLAAAVAATPAFAVECRSTQGRLMGEEIALTRTAAWNGLKQTLTLGKTKVAGGQSDGREMARTEFSCTLADRDAHCTKKDSRATAVAEVSGDRITETWTANAGGEEVLRVSYACDAEPIQFLDAFKPFVHEDRHVILHAQNETAAFCAGRNIATPISAEMVQAELDKVHAELKVDTMKDFYEFAAAGRMLVQLVGDRLARFPEQGCAALLAALPG